MSKHLAEKAATINVQVNMNSLIWWTVRDHEKFSIRIPDAKAETLHPYTLDWPSARSSTRAFSRLFLVSVSSSWQATYLFDVEHSFFRRLAEAKMLLEVASNRIMAMRSEPWGKFSPEHWISCRSWKPWNDFEDSPGKIRNSKLRETKEENERKQNKPPKTTSTMTTENRLGRSLIVYVYLELKNKTEQNHWILSKFTPVSHLFPLKK